MDRFLDLALMLFFICTLNLDGIGLLCRLSRYLAVVQALQVLNKQKQWIDAPPIPGTLVVK